MKFFQVSDEILHRKPDLESCYIAAQTMRNKIQTRFHEVPQDSRTSLRDSLIKHLLNVDEQTSSAILTQLALALANLKAIAIRLKSVKNIQKITQSMKMVSAAKYARAERDLKAARPYGVGAQSFYENAQVGRDAEGKVVPAEAGQKELYVALTSDRGLCGAIHSSICKGIRNELLEKPNLDNVAIICVGDKSRAQLAR